MKICKDPGRGVLPTQTCKQCKQVWTLNYIKEELCTCCYQRYHPNDYVYLRTLEKQEVTLKLKEIKRKAKAALKLKPKEVILSTRQKWEILKQNAKIVLSDKGWSEKDIDFLFKYI